MAEPTNLFGALVFWSYIIAALAFTTTVLITIYRLPGASSRHVWTFSALAFFSFATLSANMLHVLIQSYTLWAAQQFRHQSILGTVSPSNIWHWSISSRLFRDFGEAIVANDVRFLWTQSALLATNSVCLFMGAEGLRLRIPTLWSFFALSQILPISFAQNLFYIAVLRTPKTQTEIAFSQNTTIRITTAYCVCLLAAPYTAEGPYLIPTILVARVLLLLPMILPREKPRVHPNQAKLSKEEGTSLNFTHAFAQSVLAVLAAVMTAYRAYILFSRGASPHDVEVALVSHPAVTALGWDFLVCVISFMVWSWTRRQAKTKVA